MVATRRWTFIGLGLAVSVGVAAFLSPLASKAPDGLEHTLENLGAGEGDEEQQARVPSPMPDYAIPGIRNEFAAVAVAGAVGTLIAFLVGVAVAKVTVGKPSQTENRKEAP